MNKQIIIEEIFLEYGDKIKNSIMVHKKYLVPLSEKLARHVSQTDPGTGEADNPVLSVVSTPESEPVLLPCPFCGSKYIEIVKSSGILYVYCNDCGASGPEIEKRNEAINAWNKPARPAQSVQYAR